MPGMAFHGVAGPRLPASVILLLYLEDSLGSRPIWLLPAILEWMSKAMHVFAAALGFTLQLLQCG